MSIDVFGHALTRNEKTKETIQSAFSLTREGAYDINNKRLSNVGNPINNNDAINLTRLNKEILKLDLRIAMLRDSINELHAEQQKLDTSFKAEVGKAVRESVVIYLRHWETQRTKVGEIKNYDELYYDINK